MKRAVLAGLFILVVAAGCGRDGDESQPVTATIAWYTSMDEAEFDETPIGAFAFVPTRMVGAQEK